MKWNWALAATLILAGCHDKPKEDDMRDANVMNMQDEAPLDTAPLNDVQAPINAVEPEKPAAPPQVSDAQQIQDDADAAGMTSRLPDEPEAASSGGVTDHSSAGPDAGNAADPE